MSNSDENTAADPTAADPTAAHIDMERYGITKSTVEYFHYKTYRYTTLQEAINQARRDDPSRTRADAL